MRTSPPAAAISSSSQRKLNPATSAASSGETEIPLGAERPAHDEDAAHEVVGRLLQGAAVAVRERPEVQAHAARAFADEECGAMARHGGRRATRARSGPRAALTPSG